MDWTSFKDSTKAFEAAEKAARSIIPEKLKNKFLTGNTFWPGTEFYDKTRETYDPEKAKPIKDKNK